jgi:hypothetical protein
LEAQKTGTTNRGLDQENQNRIKEKQGIRTKKKEEEKGGWDGRPGTAQPGSGDDEKMSWTRLKGCRRCLFVQGPGLLRSPDCPTAFGDD